MPGVDGRRPETRRSWLGDERGQTFPFVITLLFAFFVLTAVVINVGQAVNRRVFVQIAADAGAFTGATEMARGLNTIAQLNGTLQQAWGKLTDATKGFSVTSCKASEMGVSGYNRVYGATSTMITLVNKGYGKRAQAEANRVTTYNAMDLFPGEEVEMGEVDSVNGFASPRPKDKVVDLMEVPSGTAPQFPASSVAKKRANWLCLAPAPVKQSGTFGLWFQKVPGNPVGFVWVVKAPATKARVFDSFFGGNIVPKITAVAAAKPVGGNIKEAKEKYVTKFIPVRDIRGSVWDEQKRKNRPVLH
ncbi:MAG: pilus assembly protein TadG-related protein [Acidobacteria bacterium]|nr:pilus assembly protein TadG-related protein [Acidobacteriota bacterium]